MGDLLRFPVERVRRRASAVGYALAAPKQCERCPDAAGEGSRFCAWCPIVIEAEQVDHRARMVLREAQAAARAQLADACPLCPRPVRPSERIAVVGDAVIAHEGCAVAWGLLKQEADTAVEGA